MSCVDLYLIETVYPAKVFSIHCVNTSELKLNFEKEISMPMFSMTSATRRSTTIKLIDIKEKREKTTNPIQAAYK